MMYFLATKKVMGASSSGPKKTKMSREECIAEMSAKGDAGAESIAAFGPTEGWCTTILGNNNWVQERLPAPGVHIVIPEDVYTDERGNKSTRSLINWTGFKHRVYVRDENPSYVYNLYIGIALIVIFFITLLLAARMT